MMITGGNVKYLHPGANGKPALYEPLQRWMGGSRARVDNDNYYEDRDESYSAGFKRGYQYAMSRLLRMNEYY